MNPSMGAAGKTSMFCTLRPETRTPSPPQHPRLTCGGVHECHALRLSIHTGSRTTISVPLCDSSANRDEHVGCATSPETFAASSVIRMNGTACRRGWGEGGSRSVRAQEARARSPPHGRGENGDIPHSPRPHPRQRLIKRNEECPHFQRAIRERPTHPTRICGEPKRS